MLFSQSISITFPRVLITFLHVPPWFSKRFVSISYVPIRSVQTFHVLNKFVLEYYVPIRSVSTLPRKRENLHLKYTFLYVPCRQSRRNAKSSIELIRSHTFRATPPTDPANPPKKDSEGGLRTHHAWLGSNTFCVDSPTEIQKTRFKAYVLTRSGQPLPQNLNIAWPIWTASRDPGNAPWGS